METLIQDFRFAARVLGKSPGFTAIAVLTLALGIGSTTAIFSVVSGLLLKPLNYRDPARLVIVTERDLKTGTKQPAAVSYINYSDWREQQRSFSDMALFRAPVPFEIRPAFGLIIAPIRMVSANFFSLLGVSPMIGRSFTPDDDRPGAPATVLLTYSGWQKYFAGYATTFNDSISINGEKYTVIGVLPKEFTFYGETDAYIPIGLSREPWTRARERRPNLSVIARLNPDASLARAQQDLDGIARRLAREFPEANQDRGVVVTSLLDDMVDEDLQSSLWLFMASVLCVLLLSCANVANLLLSRGKARQKELSIRAALGAGRIRVVRQLLAESVLLAIVGGVAGLIVAISGTDLLILTAPAGLPRIENIGLDWRVLCFALTISIFTGVLFGIAPALQVLRTDINGSLKEAGTSVNPARFAVQKVLVTGEVAIALVLLLAAGLTLRSTAKATNIDSGINPNGLVQFRLVIPPNEYATGGQVRDFYHQVEARLRTMAGVQAVEAGFGGLPKPFAVGRNYLRLTGVRLIQGRFFDGQERPDSPHVVVIDDVIARTKFPGESPIGKTLNIDGNAAKAFGFDRPQVIGVVSRVRRFDIEEDEDVGLQSQIYFSIDQIPDDAFEGAPLGLIMLLKTSLPISGQCDACANNLVRQLTTNILLINKNVGFFRLATMDDAMDLALGPRRYRTKLFGAFAVMAFLLAVTGVYGTMAYVMSQRRREMGIRMALGAEPRRVMRSAVLNAGALAGIGITVGLIASYWLRQFIAHYLFEMTPNDAPTYLAASGILFAATVAASAIPAFAASSLDPMTALTGLTGRTATGGSAASHIESTEVPAIIEVQNLQKIYRNFRGKRSPALAGVTLRVEPGTIFGLIGQNGAGKTTLVKILLGLCERTAGTARLLGCSPGDPIAQRKIGYLPESMCIPDHFMAEDCLRFIGRLNGVEADPLEKRIPKLLETVGLGGIQKPVKAFSKGMQQRLGLAQALVNDPELLFLDEPTDGLDPLGRIHVRDLLLRLRSEGKTIFLNSHLLSEVELVCDRIVILEKGLVACTTTPAEFTRGTGEYVVRAVPVNTAVLELTARITGEARWNEGELRFAPRDLDQLNALLDEIRRAGVQIVSVEPVRLSLEQFFIDVVQAGAKKET